MERWTDRYRDWRGTAAELAAVAEGVLGGMGAADDVTPSERLVRHYAQQGVLERAERHGKEAIFGFRQLVELVAARQLLRDGWPLAKIAEFNRATGLDGLLELVPDGHGPNRAQELVAMFQRGDQALPHGPPPPEPAVPSAPDAAMPGGGPLPGGAPPPDSRLPRWARLTREKIVRRRLHDALGNPPEAPRRERLVRLVLAPWCHVHVEPDALAQSPPGTEEMLGQALAQSLSEERVRIARKGGRGRKRGERGRKGTGRRDRKRGERAR